MTHVRIRIHQKKKAMIKFIKIQSNNMESLKHSLMIMAERWTLWYNITRKKDGVIHYRPSEPAFRAKLVNLEISKSS
jgi:hypothetical protein